MATINVPLKLRKNQDNPLTHTEVDGNFEALRNAILSVNASKIDTTSAEDKFVSKEEVANKFYVRGYLMFDNTGNVIEGRNLIVSREGSGGVYNITLEEQIRSSGYVPFVSSIDSDTFESQTFSTSFWQAGVQKNSIKPDSFKVSVVHTSTGIKAASTIANDSATWFRQVFKDPPAGTYIMVLVI